MPTRLALLALLAPLAAGSAQPRNTWPPPPEPREVRLEWGVRVPLRDGLIAPVTIYRPADQVAPLPVILMITPYQADAFHPTAMYFARRGYVVATADTRGRGHTDGEWKPFVNDGTLGYDLVEWLAKQPWSDGQVAMAGISYMGFAQWTTLKEFPPHLASLVPTAAAYFSYTSLHPWNIFSTYAIRWLTGVSGRSLNGQLTADQAWWDRVNWEWYSNHLPFAALDSVAGNRTTEFQTWIRHPAHGPYVEATAVRPEDYPRVTIPILTVAGYFDSEQRAALRHYRRHMQFGNASAKDRHHLILGPWDHVATFWPRRNIGGLVFDTTSVLDMGTIHTQWFDWTLKRGARPDFLKNRVAYYLMGAEEWRYADDLDGVTAEMRSLRLGSPRGAPTSSARAGTLSPAAPAAAGGPDRWVNDPLDTRPGAWERGRPETYVEPADSLELFGAGLVYDTSPLAEPLDLAGVPRLRLWLAMDVLDTDFSATLYEVTGDGRAIFLTRQLQRARYREGLESERLMTPGAVTPFVLDDFEFFARRIAAGSRVRLVVAALNSLGYEKNYNTGGVVAFESGRNARTARVDLYHDARHPSALELPVAADSRARLASESGTGMTTLSAPSQVASADALFKAARFAEAERLYAAAASAEPGNVRALVQLGRLAVLSNRFADAERWLTQARALAPGDRTAQQLLAQTWYRQDRFADAAPLYRGSGNELMARLLEGFRGLTPYQIEGEGDRAVLEFAQLDPIPVIKVRVNGRDAHFILDTGGSEIYLEPDFAREVGAEILSGTESGGFAGGQTRPVEKGRVASVTLDRFTVRNVPVNIVDTKFIGRDQVAPGFKINGFLGTIMLYHFLPTIDYPEKKLVLRKRTDASLRAVEAEAARTKQVVRPFWLAGDHLILTWGGVPPGDSALLLLDTGGAGIGFVPGPALLKSAGLTLPRQPTAAEPFVMFTADVVAVGPLTGRNIPSVFGPFPEAMESSLGFHLAGIVSHEFFKPYALTIDFTGMRLFLEPGR